MKLCKLFAICLALTLLLSMTACGGKGWESFNEKVTTKATELAAQDGSILTIDPVEYNDGYVDIPVKFRNAASGMKVLSLADFAVNGVMTECYMSVDVEGDISATETIRVSEDALRLRGVFGISTLDFCFSVFDEETQTNETLTCQIKSSAPKKYKTSDQAYQLTLTNQKAQEALGYTVINNQPQDEETADLGYDIYLKSQAHINMAGKEYLLLEVVNQGEEMRYVQIGTSSVNHMFSDGGENCSMLPGTKAVIALDMDQALSAALREAFNMEDICTVSLYSDIYGYTKTGEIDWDDSGEYRSFTYTHPEKTSTLDLSGTVIYNENGLKISAKKAVQQVVGEDLTESYVYLIFENTGDANLIVMQNEEKEIETDGTSAYTYFDNPYFIGVGDVCFGYLEADNMTGTQAVLPLFIQNETDSALSWDFNLNIPF